MLLTTLAMLTSVVTFPSAFGTPSVVSRYESEQGINGAITYDVTIDRYDMSPVQEEPISLLSVGNNGGELWLHTESENHSPQDEDWTMIVEMSYPVTPEFYNLACYIEFDDGGENNWFKGGFYADFLTLQYGTIYTFEAEDTRFQLLSDEINFRITLMLVSEETYNVATSDVNGYYQNGYNAGYTAGESDGFALGDQNGYNDGYQDGYTAGYSEADSQDSTALTIFTGIVNVGLLPVNVFLQILNFEVFGINIGALVSSFLTIAIVLILWRIISGNKND